MSESNANGGGARRVGRRRLLKGAGLLGLGLAVSAACRDGGGPPPTTLDATIAIDSDGNLVRGPAEPYAVRTDLAQAQARREDTRRSLAVFHHFSDFRMTDEESPLRSEWVESCLTPLSTSAFRPHESLSTQAAAAIVVQANRIDRSPVTGRPVDLALHTGNAADNAQYNELRWFLDLMDGKEITPSSGKPEYEGVQTESPSPNYPDLLERAQFPFTPEPLRYPWYAVVGNHDVLAQGNIPPSESTTISATGSGKIISVGPTARDEVCADPAALLKPDTSEKILGDPDTEVRLVSPDENRRLLSRKEWVEEHFKTGEAPGPQGHGFTQENRDAGTAYYVLDHGPVSFIVLDSVNPGGFSAGSIDADQFVWLEQRLVERSGVYFDAEGRPVATQNEDKLIVVASHHTAAAMNNPFPDPASQSERIRGPQLQQLLFRFPNVILHVAGHTLGNRIAARPDPAKHGGSYWEVTTTSPGDYPMQSRLIEIVDNGDGTVSLFATVYDSAAAVKPGETKDPTPGDGLNEGLLASLARQIAVRDPQVNMDAAGPAAGDRNAELLLNAPFDLSKLQPEASRMTRRGLLRRLAPRPGIAG